MKFRDKEKDLLSNVFLKTGEYILSIIILGQVISQKLNPKLFFIGLLFFVASVILALIFSSLTKEE